MNETLLSKPTTDYGIKIAGLDKSKITKSAGVTYNNDSSISIAGNGVVDYLRIPATGLPNITSPTPACDITIDFVMFSYPAAYHSLWSKARQAATPFGVQLFTNPTGLVRVQDGTGGGVWLSKRVLLNQRNVINIHRLNNSWNIYHDGVLDQTMTLSMAASAHDYLLGTYLNSSNAPIAAGAVASPVRWDILNFIVK